MNTKHPSDENESLTTQDEANAEDPEGTQKAHLDFLLTQREALAKELAELDAEIELFRQGGLNEVEDAARKAEAQEEAAKHDRAVEADPSILNDPPRTEDF